MQITFDTSDYRRLANLIAASGNNVPVAASHALNHTTKKARTQMVRSMVPQTGLKYGTIRRALKLEPSSPATLTAAVYSKGGDISLKYFGPKEAGDGASAKPRNQRQHFSGGFIMGGRVGSRVTLKMGGHVYKRTGAARLPIVKEKSGVVIPEEMVEDASRDAFFRVAQADLPNRLAHELLRLL